jgi:apolipoprotein N-acyltransferase
MIHYGGLPAPLAYLLLVPGALVIGLFPALFALLTAISIKRWGTNAVLLAPIFWGTCEWFRLGVTGQLWNAIGYSQAEVFGGVLIQPARWGGVYGVGFLIVAVNASIAFALLRTNLKTFAIAAAVVVGSGVVLFLAFIDGDRQSHSGVLPSLHVIAIQPNVPMTIVKTVEETKALLDRHLVMSVKALNELPKDNVPRLVVWPESPMNFTYANDASFRDLVTRFTRDNHTSLLFNSLEPAANEGSYNSALLINEEGRLIAQYDKIRLLAFGEYVPIPRWLGGSLISGLVGTFTPGDKYTLMPVGGHRAGVFICIESAYPSIARRLTHEGADVLINISNDGYLGPTAVMRQHLANAIFRAVENGRPLFRVTNSGLSAEIRADGYVQEVTTGFEPAVRSWKVSSALSNQTFYTEHGDLVVQLCTGFTVLLIGISVIRKKRVS